MFPRSLRLKLNLLSEEIQVAIEEELDNTKSFYTKEGYKEGYDSGYSDGYKDGEKDGLDER